MLPAEQYAIVIPSITLYVAIIAFLVYRFRHQLKVLGLRFRRPFLRHLVYRPFLRSRDSLSQWSRADVLAETLYLGFIIVWVWFKSASLAAAGRRAANMCIGNLIFLCLTPHLDTLTNTLGLQWRSTRRLHGSIGVVAFLLLGFHVATIMTSYKPLHPDTEPSELWAIIAAGAMCLCILLSLPFVRNNAYELFLHLHRCLNIILIYGMWVHLSSQPWLPRLQLYMLLGVGGLSMAVLGIITVRRNWLCLESRPRADFLNKNGAVLVRVYLSRPVQVRAGQYISLWVSPPWKKIHRIFEYHPFMVASWSDIPVDKLDLLIEPRSGLTRYLLDRSRKLDDVDKMHEGRDDKRDRRSPALFSGPHGNSVPVVDYEVVVLIASGYGIAAQLPYLKQLLHGYNSRKAKTRRIRLVWQLKTLDLSFAVQGLLNDALEDDTKDHGYILEISVFVENIRKEGRISNRAEVKLGLADWDTILSKEINGENIKRFPEEHVTLPENAIVTVSASPSIRQKTQDIIRQHLHDAPALELVELDYQPFS